MEITLVRYGPSSAGNRLRSNHGKSKVEHGEAGKDKLVVKSQIMSCLASGQPSRNGGVHSLGCPIWRPPKNHGFFFTFHVSCNNCLGFAMCYLRGEKVWDKHWVPRILYVVWYVYECYYNWRKNGHEASRLKCMPPWPDCSELMQSHVKYNKVNPINTVRFLFFI